ncbi:hypothetical protein [Tepidimicrobium xylanilyticum]|uniref:Uncharacterized protein n=1 Tax=Tepidimicrobium xylanilyticum TaxID=1123352 RepID=A0A1H2QNH4_9FIRM|nr:hypothetical protein [Tepidimicrobium xylanilyticum]GMG95616.1 hypothetical protein EN5CB1_04420 [Tepidimicrobium xylanilyticum]SDW08757.1 hypothetical protein SAMN05660923_00191 [Tepidimicrobium xylanilyticum]
MFRNDIIDQKIHALLEAHNDFLDETKDEDMLLYFELRDFAEKHGGLLYFFENETYLIINFIGEEEFLLIPAEYSL